MVSLARRLRPAKKMDIEEAAEVVDNAQDHLISVAWAHIDRILFEALLEAESEVESEDARRVFEQVRHVFFLDMIKTNAAWYLEQNLLTGTRTKAARAALNDLVDSLVHGEAIGGCLWYPGQHLECHPHAGSGEPHPEVRIEPGRRPKRQLALRLSQCQLDYRV